MGDFGRKNLSREEEKYFTGVALKMDENVWFKAARLQS